MRFSREEMINAAERYMEMPWIHCRELDWLILNMLVYAELQATLDSFRVNSMFLFSYVSKKAGDTKFNILMTILKSVAFLVKWSIWLAIIFVSVEISSFATGILAAITVFWQWKKWKVRQKINNVMSEMIRTYSSLSTISQSWLVVWEQLKKSRDVGAVWDGIVYRLVEERLSTLGRFQPS